ncbi:MAG: hypothetical protein ACRDH7_02270 [Actinomycetota bacterium]
MSCYTRHLEDWLPPDPTADDKRSLDRVIRGHLGMADADCPEVWAIVKERRDEPAFANAVRSAMEEND